MMLKLALLTLICGCALAAVVKPLTAPAKALQNAKAILSNVRLTANKGPPKPATNTLTGGAKVNQAQKAFNRPGPRNVKKQEGSQPRMLLEGARRRINLPEIDAPLKEEEFQKDEEIPCDEEEQIPEITTDFSVPFEDLAGPSFDVSSGGIPEKEIDLPEEDIDLTERKTDLSREDIDHRRCSRHRGCRRNCWCRCHCGWQWNPCFNVC